MWFSSRESSVQALPVTVAPFLTITTSTRRVKNPRPPTIRLQLAAQEWNLDNKSRTIPTGADALFGFSARLDPTNLNLRNPWRLGRHEPFSAGGLPQNRNLLCGEIREQWRKATTFDHEIVG